MQDARSNKVVNRRRQIVLGYKNLLFYRRPKRKKLNTIPPPGVLDGKSSFNLRN